jgi:hypothetical protein
MEMNMQNKDTLERNLSRLVKLAGSPETPRQAFTDSLIDSAMQELARGERATSSAIRVDRFMRAAAVVAIVSGALTQIALSALAWTYPSFAQTLFFAGTANWLTYVGKMII